MAAAGVVHPAAANIQDLARLLGDSRKQPGPFRFADEVNDLASDGVVSRRTVRKLGPRGPILAAALSQSLPNAPAETGLIFLSATFSLERTAEECQSPRGGATFALYGAADQAAALLARELGLGGPVVALSSACSGGAAAVTTALQWREAGLCRDVLILACEFPFFEPYMASFEHIGVFSPSGKCRPFDLNRDGFVPTEAAATLLLTDLSLAAPILGLTSDRPGVRGARSEEPMVVHAVIGASIGFVADSPWGPAPDRFSRMLADVLETAGASAVPQNPMWYVAHGTGTVPNDAAEAEIVAGLPTGTVVSGIKGLLGHAESAAAILDLICSMISAEKGECFPTFGCEESAFPGIAVLRQRAPLPRGHTVCASFGLGGYQGVVVTSHESLI